MKTHVIKFGDGCTLIVTLLDRNGQVIRPATLKTLAVGLTDGTTTVQNIGFTLNADGTVTIVLTRLSHLRAVGTYHLTLDGTLADGQAYSNSDQIIEVKVLEVSTATSFTTSIILCQVHVVDETNYPIGLDGLGFEPFDPTVPYAKDKVVIYAGRLYRFTSTHTAGIWKESQVEETDIQTLLDSGKVMFDRTQSLTQQQAVIATSNINAVSYGANQRLTETQQAVARNNIGAARAVGEEPDLVAGDIMPKSDAPVEVSGKFAAQTTGGDADIKNGTAQLRAIKGNLDASLNPFYANTFVSTGMNLVDPREYYTVLGDIAYYFPVVAGHFGSYGTTQENNGYVVLGGNVLGVRFSANKPRQEDVAYTNLCPYTETNGNSYYLPPSAGWMIIIVHGNTPPACHVAWSNYNDKVEGTFGNSTINIRAAIAAVHAWGLAGFKTAAKTVQDVVDLEAGKGYACCDRALLKDLTWTMQTVTVTDDNSQTTTTYVFTATVAAMADNGLCAYDFEGLENEGNLLDYSSETINSVNDLKAALGTSLIYYEKAVPTEVTLPATESEFDADDFGLTYFMADGELAQVAAYVEAAYQQGGKDQLFNAVTYQKLMAEVVATALCEMDRRLAALEGRRDVACSSLSVARKFDMQGWRLIDEQPASATAPGRLGDYYIATDALYICVAENTWKKITIANFS